jgi:hypothetical protein
VCAAGVAGPAVGSAMPKLPSQPGTIRASERWVIMDTRLPMTLVGKLSVLTAYVAFAFVGAIVLGMI